MSKITEITTNSTKATDWTVEATLRELLKDMGSGAIPKYDKVFIALGEGEDGVGFRMAGMEVVEGLGLIELSKAQLLKTIQGVL